MTNPTLKHIKSIGRELTVRKTDGEYRIAYAIPAIMMARDCDYNEAREANEASAYYTSDASDALDTAVFMHNSYVNNPHCLKG